MYCFPITWGIEKKNPLPNGIKQQTIQLKRSRCLWMVIKKSLHFSTRIACIMQLFAQHKHRLRPPCFVALPTHVPVRRCADSISNEQKALVAHTTIVPFSPCRLLFDFWRCCSTQISFYSISSFVCVYFVCFLLHDNRGTIMACIFPFVLFRKYKLSKRKSNYNSR